MAAVGTKEAKHIFVASRDNDQHNNNNINTVIIVSTHTFNGQLKLRTREVRATKAKNTNTAFRSENSLSYRRYKPALMYLCLMAVGVGVEEDGLWWSLLYVLLPMR